MSSRTVDFAARIPREPYNEFKENFPMYGATTWFIETALIEFNALVRENPSLKAHVAQAVANMVRRDTQP